MAILCFFVVIFCLCGWVFFVFLLVVLFFFVVTLLLFSRKVTTLQQRVASSRFVSFYSSFASLCSHFIVVFCLFQFFIFGCFVSLLGYFAPF